MLVFHLNLRTIHFCLYRWVTEKYDGIRACWVSEIQLLYHFFEVCVVFESIRYGRNGNIVSIPAIFTKGLQGQCTSDLEIWFGTQGMYNLLICDQVW